MLCNRNKTIVSTLVAATTDTPVYSFEKSKRRFDAIKKKFRSLDDNKLNKKDRKFIFIIGMPRSGTTLVESIISTADHCAAGGPAPPAGRPHPHSHAPGCRKHRRS